jgi:hypothetical protein
MALNLSALDAKAGSLKGAEDTGRMEAGFAGKRGAYKTISQI